MGKNKNKISTSEEFLKSLLESQTLLSQQESNLKAVKSKIEKPLRSRLDDDVNFYFGGSIEKDTALKERLDLNVVVYWPMSAEKDSIMVYEELGKAVEKNWRRTAPKEIGYEVEFKANFHLDVIPAILIDQEQKYADFFNATLDDTINTSIELQEEMIKYEKRSAIIKLMKLWVLRKEVPFNSFILELMIIEACKGLNRNELEKQMIQSLEYIEKNIETLEMMDPANPRNDISHLVKPDERAEIKELTVEALEEKTWNKLFK